MTYDERETFEFALKKWGTEAQVNMLHEEIGELLVSLNKLYRAHSADERSSRRDSVVEEIADVGIMLDQVVIAIGASDKEVENERREKVERLRFRLRMPVLP